MKSFNFYQDIKCTVWTRQWFSIDAETEEEAVEKAKSYRDKDVACEEYVFDCERLTDTEEYMLPNENDGNATMEVYKMGDSKYDGDLIASNDMNYQKELIGYQIYDKKQEMPEGLFSFQVFRTRKRAEQWMTDHDLWTERERWGIHPIYDTEIEEPTYI